MPCLRSVVGRHARACFVVFSLAAMHSFARQGLLQPEDTTLPVRSEVTGVLSNPFILFFGN